MAKPSDGAKKLIGDFSPKLVELTDRVLFDDVWERKELSKRDRSLVTMAALVALNRPRPVAIPSRQSPRERSQKRGVDRGHHSPGVLLRMAECNDRRPACKRSFRKKLIANDPDPASIRWTEESMAEHLILEVCADSIESAITADRAGAHRVELCSSLAEGGVTPSPGLIATVLSKVSLGVFVMIRPRAGDFCYSLDEFNAMEQDVSTAKQLGADGVVFGILKEDGRVDVPRVRRLIEVARPLKVTFHRAFDMSRDLSESLEDVISAGVDRILTSGGEQNVELGKKKIAQLVQAAKDRVNIMAGAGLTEQNVRQIVCDTGVREVHASLRTAMPSPMLHRNEKLSLGSVTGPEYERLVVGEQRVRTLLAVLEGLPETSYSGNQA